jgi:hypothetical protein
MSSQWVKCTFLNTPNYPQHPGLGGYINMGLARQVYPMGVAPK